MDEIRSNCPRCGDTRGRLYTKKVTNGYIRFCHNNNCFKNDSFIGNRNKTPSEIMNNIKTITSTIESKEIETQVQIKLPHDFTNNIVKEGLIWLQKYDITNQDIITYNIGYSKRFNRVILPVYNEEGDLIYWQGRNLGKISKENPKYINLRNKGAKNVYFKSQQGCVEVCIVEDILSAIKVGKVTDSIALLGSYFPADFIKVCDNYNQVSIWLDNDKYFTAIDQSKRLALFNKKVRVIKTDLDPKEYSENDISHILFGGL